MYILAGITGVGNRKNEFDPNPAFKVDLQVRTRPDTGNLSQRSVRSIPIGRTVLRLKIIRDLSVGTCTCQSGYTTFQYEMGNRTIYLFKLNLSVSHFTAYFTELERTRR